MKDKEELTHTDVHNHNEETTMSTYNFIDEQMNEIACTEVEIEHIEIHDVDWYNDDDPETQAAMNLEDTRRFLEHFRSQLGS